MVHINVSCKNVRQAQSIAAVLLRRRLVACVSWWPITSRYWWRGKLHTDREVLLSCKTIETKQAAVTRLILQLHRYTLPVITIEKQKTTPAVMAWMKQSINNK